MPLYPTVITCIHFFGLPPSQWFFSTLFYPYILEYLFIISSLNTFNPSQYIFSNFPSEVHDSVLYNFYWCFSILFNINVKRVYKEFFYSFFRCFHRGSSSVTRFLVVSIVCCALRLSIVDGVFPRRSLLGCVLNRYVSDTYTALRYYPVVQ